MLWWDQRKAYMTRHGQVGSTLLPDTDGSAQESRHTVDEGVRNELPVLLHQVVDVTENATVETNLVSVTWSVMLSKVQWGPMCFVRVTRPGLCRGCTASRLLSLAGCCGFRSPSRSSRWGNGAKAFPQHGRIAHAQIQAELQPASLLCSPSCHPPLSWTISLSLSFSTSSSFSFSLLFN